ncbi:42565_t:CDS:2 [Gigaspora margarita]|uniref:42565_t:CDS:1 n=1 Tax=Gigaspora margarita TaxID=4874 RepID=A0ABN7V5Z9_GIGMA|nr:42565_t:CDS:2 [Gigaspora margarita]
MCQDNGISLLEVGYDEKPEIIIPERIRKIKETNEYIYLNCLITLYLPYHFFQIKVFDGSDVESLETQVQARLSLLPSGATSTPHQFLRFCPTQRGYINMYPHTNLYPLQY